MSHLSQRTSKPAYYIVDCWISYLHDVLFTVSIKTNSEFSIFGLIRTSFTSLINSQLICFGQIQSDFIGGLKNHENSRFVVSELVFGSGEQDILYCWYLDLIKNKITFLSILLYIFTYVELFTLIKFNYLVSFCHN